MGEDAGLALLPPSLDVCELAAADYIIIQLAMGMPTLSSVGSSH